MAASHLFMVRPAAFGYNVQTAESNSFQNQVTVAEKEIQQLAIKEFDALVHLLQQHDIAVTVHQDTAPPAKPDAIFPNNWFSTHADGTLVLYPMQAANRRLERTPEAIAKVQELFKPKRILDYTSFENENLFLEGTGSLVFDHCHSVCFAALSTRTHKHLAHRLCTDLGYRCIDFVAVDALGKEVYHTNVVMNVDELLAVVCLDAITQNRNEVEAVLHQNHRAVIYISRQQMQQFAGNMLMVKNKHQQNFLLMSSAAYQSLTDTQIKSIENYCTILHIPIPTIETIGGGSVRCMLAEIFR